MRHWRAVSLALFLFLTAVSLIWQLFAPQQTPSVRGKTPALPLAAPLTPAQLNAQNAALSHPLVQAATVGRQSELFEIQRVGFHYPAGFASCADGGCRLVQFYRFDDDSTVTAVVDSRSRVTAVYTLTGAQPGISRQQADRAIRLAMDAPEVAAALGHAPTAVDMAPVPADLGGSACASGHLCAGPTFRVGSRILWAVVDLTADELAGINWTDVSPDGRFQPTATVGAGCPAPGVVNRDGWTLAYETTASDGLLVKDVTFGGTPVLTSAKLAEWHVDYNGTYTYAGFVDVTGCGNGGGGFPIAPYGETAVLDLVENSAVVGFEVVQDFRMNSWGAACNYRYEQRMQFWADGRFRVVGGAYGRGCGDFPVYRPVLRMDVAVAGDGGDTAAFWGGGQWQTAVTETIRLPEEIATTPQGYSGRVLDSSGKGYYIVPGQGQFGDGGRGDNAFWYLTRYHDGEGGFDLPNLGTCCQDDATQGPEAFVNGENVVAENIVLWVVPQLATDATLDDGTGYYCWTVNGEPNPESYPCFAGPMFVPFEITYTQRLFLPLLWR